MKLASFTLLSSLFVAAFGSPVDVTRREDAYPANFKPNFNSDFSVTIPRPLPEVFRILGTREGLGPHILLSSIASDFTEGAFDTVPVSGALADAFVREAPAGPGLPRQAFKYKETIETIPGLSFLNIEVLLEGTFTSDEAGRVALYETKSDGGIQVKKVRRFEEVPEGTRVVERIDGQCPLLQQPIVQLTARKAHKEQMNLYSTLFP